MGTLGSIEYEIDGDDGPEVRVLLREIRGDSEDTPWLFPGLGDALGSGGCAGTESLGSSVLCVSMVLVASGGILSLSGDLCVSSSSPPSSSASLESELSDSSCMASFTLSRTSTVAKDEATGRARRPRITAYRRLARSLSLLMRSKCLVMLVTLFPGGSTPRRAATPLPMVPEAARGCALSFPGLRPCLEVAPRPTTLEANPLPWRLCLVTESESAEMRGFSGDC